MSVVLTRQLWRATMTFVAGVCAMAMGAIGEPLFAATLTFWEGHSTQEEEATRMMIALFEDTRPGIRVERVKTDFGNDFEKVFLALAGGVAPDVTPIWGGLLARFAREGALANLGPYGIDELREALFPAGWDFVTYENGVYGIPYAVDPRFLVYNQDLFDEHGVSGPPRDWDELATIARKLTRHNGDSIERSGFGIGNWEDFVASFIWANGGRFLNEDQTAVLFDRPETVEAFTYLHDLVHSLEVARVAGREDFLRGNVAMYVDGPWIFYEHYIQGSSMNFGVDHIPVPAGRPFVNFGSVGAYVVYEHSSLKDVAADFVMFMGSTEAQAFRVQKLKTGIRADVLGDPRLEDVLSRYPQLIRAHEILEYSRITPNHPLWAQIRDAVLDAFNRSVVDARESPGAALARAAESMNALLREFAIQESEF